MGVWGMPVKAAGNRPREVLYYSLLVEKKLYEDLGELDSFGVLVERVCEDTNGMIDSAMVRDITTIRGVAAELFDRIVSGRVSPIHMPDVVLDFINK